MRQCLSTKKYVSRKFNSITEQRLEDLMTIRLKPKSEAKVNWGVNAYNEWRDYRLKTFNYDVGIYYANLNDLGSLEKENLNHALCRFIPEVTKQRGDGQYPGHTLYQMICAIQKHLNVNKIPWKLLEGEGTPFADVRVVLDNVMKERTVANIGVNKKQAGVVTLEMENKLWNEGLLGEHTPDILRNTVLFLIGINTTLRAIEEHYYLHREMPYKSSQLQFERDPDGVKCLVYREDAVSKTHDGGIDDRKSDRKEVWVYLNDDTNRCTVRLVEKYLALCPRYFKKENFYLQSLQKPTPPQWYGEQVIGKNTISKVVSELMQKGKFEGFFTNHSLHRSGGTHLFRAGVDRKLIKEVTGHKSDSVDAYQITGHDQRRMISNVVQGKISHASETEVKSNESKEHEPNVILESKGSDGLKSVVNSGNLSDFVKELVNASNKKGKTIIRIEIEMNNE